MIKMSLRKFDISVIVVFRNEELYLKDCIRSIENQFKNTDIKYELILVDGQSVDSSVEIAKSYLSTKNISYKIISNEKNKLAPGWNLGIKNSEASYVVRPDAHSYLHEDYIIEGIRTLEGNERLTAVGGKLITKGKGFWGRVIKDALSCKVGVGNSSFRTESHSGIKDTAVYAVYRKTIFDEVGYFNENLVRHQDNEMHNRIKKAGGIFYFNTNMVADYYCRNTIKKLVKQMFAIGVYLPDVMFSGALSYRHFCPLAFYLLVFFLLVNSIFFLAFGIIFLYLFIIFCNVLIVSIRNKRVGSLLNVFIIPLIHVSYALGTMVGLIKKSFNIFKFK